MEYEPDNSQQRSAEDKEEKPETAEIRRLFEEHNILSDELSRLLAEEQFLLSNDPDVLGVLDRLMEITRSSAEIIARHGQIERHLALYLKPNESGAE